MRKRNVEAWAIEGKKRMKEKRELKLSELNAIYNACKGDLFDCVLMAFRFGFNVGYRQSKEEKAGE